LEKARRGEIEDKKTELITENIEILKEIDEQVRAMMINMEAFRILRERPINKEWQKFVLCKKILKNDLKNDRRNRRKEREARRKREEREMLAEFLDIQKRMNPELYEWFDEIYQMFIKEEYEKIEKIDIYKIYKYTTNGNWGGDKNHNIN